MPIPTSERESRGAIIESVTGKDVSTFMREYLFAPLGIDAAYSATQLDEAEAYLTATYHKDGSLYRAPSYILRQPYDAFATPDTHYRITVGSLADSPRDLTAWALPSAATARWMACACSAKTPSP